MHTNKGIYTRWGDKQMNDIIVALKIVGLQFFPPCVCWLGL